jgi:hypothetical protein
MLSTSYFRISFPLLRTPRLIWTFSAPSFCIPSRSALDERRTHGIYTETSIFRLWRVFLINFNGRRASLVVSSSPFFVHSPLIGLCGELHTFKSSDFEESSWLSSRLVIRRNVASSFLHTFVPDRTLMGISLVKASTSQPASEWKISNSTCKRDH